MDQSIDFVGPKNGQNSLAARLASRRDLAVDVLPVERMEQSDLAQLEALVGAQRLLFKLEVLINSAESSTTTAAPIGGREEAIQISLGVATRAEWRDLVLASVSLFA